MTTPAPIPNTQAYAVFCGQIDQAAVQRIFQTLTTAIGNRFSHFHLLFQSTGGYVGDGVCLYNFFRSLPIDLTLYNVGSIQSIGVVAYLGAKHRKTSARATFMIHRTFFSPQIATSHSLKASLEALSLDDARTESILRDHLRLPEEKWNALKSEDLFFSGEEAIRLGFADEFGEFSAPPGNLIFNI
jgi:ATP-dependent Clp protease protease subunit